MRGRALKRWDEGSEEKHIKWANLLGERQYRQYPRSLDMTAVLIVCDPVSAEGTTLSDATLFLRGFLWGMGDEC